MPEAPAAANARVSEKPAPGFPESAVDRLLSAHLSNSQYNRLVWTLYPLFSSAASRLRGEREGLLGTEWAPDGSVETIVDEYIRPYVTAASVVGEIGVGGGRVATKIAGEVRELYCFDVSSRMLKRARRALAGHESVHYTRLRRPACPPELRGRLDFVYAFDVLVHLDLHTIWRYLVTMRDLLRPDGRALVHVASLATPVGWEKFARQRGFSVSGFYFLCPELVAILAGHAGLRTFRAAEPDAGNLYLSRDYVVVLERAS
jgi:SAM-dependent methyltransferase